MAVRGEKKIRREKSKNKEAEEEKEDETYTLAHDDGRVSAASTVKVAAQRDTIVSSEIHLGMNSPLFSKFNHRQKRVQAKTQT